MPKPCREPTSRATGRSVRAAALGDYNGDGNADILWRNTTSGEIYDWLTQDNGIIGQHSFGNPGAVWSIVG